MDKLEGENSAIFPSNNVSLPKNNYGKHSPPFIEFRAVEQINYGDSNNNYHQLRTHVQWRTLLSAFDLQY